MRRSLGRSVPAQSVCADLQKRAESNKGRAYPRLTHLPIPQVANVLYHEVPVQPGNAEVRMVLGQKMGESIQGRELAHTVSGTVNGEVVSHVFLDEVSKPGLGDTRKIQVVSSACHVDLQAHFVEYPIFFLHLGPVVVGVSHDPIHLAKPANHLVFSVLVVHQHLLRVDIFVGVGLTRYFPTSIKMIAGKVPTGRDSSPTTIARRAMRLSQVMMVRKHWRFLLFLPPSISHSLR